MHRLARHAAPATAAIALLAGGVQLRHAEAHTPISTVRPLPSTLQETAAMNAVFDTLTRAVRSSLQLAARRLRDEPSLHELDSRTLADIGIGRSEATSIEAEAYGMSPTTRLRIVALPRQG